MKKVLVVEDEALVAHDLAEMIEAEGFQVIGPCSSATEALSALKKQSADLALLDIHIEGDIDGLHLGRILKEDYQIPLVFLTSYSDAPTLQRIQSLQPKAYMVKPYRQAEVITNLHLIFSATHAPVKAELEEQGEEAPFLFVKTDSGLERVCVEDILYLEAFDNYCFLHHKKGKFLITHTLKSAEAKLPSQSFMRCHRSYVVNLKAISAISDEQEVHLGDIRLPMSRNAKSDILKRISLL